MASTFITTRELSGMRVIGGKKGTKRIGKVRRFVFHPREKRCVGFIVKRPDLLWMFHRKDIFVPIDGYDLVDGRIVIHPDAITNGRAACKALGIDWDSCVLWVGMPVMTEDGQAFGAVGNVEINRLTGAVRSFETDSGATANALLGKRTIDVSMVRGFRTGMGVEVSQTETEGEEPDEAVFGAILVSDEVKGVEAEGGAAEKAGAATAIAMDKVTTVVDKVKPQVSAAAEKTGEAVNKGAFATGRQIARSKTMFGDFKREYDKARGIKEPSASETGSTPSTARAAGASEAAEAVEVAEPIEAAEAVEAAEPTETVSDAIDAVAEAEPERPAPVKKRTAPAKKKPAPKKNMFAAFKEEYDKARRGE